MSGDKPRDDNELFRQLLAKQRAERESQLTAAKEQQHTAGKEPFDLDSLERIYDTTTEAGALGSRESRQRQYEVYYYLLYPKVMTLGEFAKAKAKNDLWRN